MNPTERKAMITVYAIVATFFLGAFTRHNWQEFVTSYKDKMNHRKFKREMLKEQKKREAAEAKITAAAPSS